MYQSGIVRVVHGDREVHMCKNDTTRKMREVLYALMNRATFTPPLRFTIQQISYSDINFPEIFDKTITRSIE